MPRDVGTETERHKGIEGDKHKWMQKYDAATGFRSLAIWMSEAGRNRLDLFDPNSSRLLRKALTVYTYWEELHFHSAHVCSCTSVVYHSAHLFFYHWSLYSLLYKAPVVGYLNPSVVQIFLYVSTAAFAYPLFCRSSWYNSSVIGSGGWGWGWKGGTVVELV